MTEILLIEDDSDLRELLAIALGHERFIVHRAADGQAGISLARLHRPALILCDVMMAGMDGYEVLAALRADPKLANIPFIFLSACGEKKDLRLGMVSGADDYLTKPVSIDDLLAAIRSRISRRAELASKSPDFSDATPLQRLGLTPKQAEVLLWVSQGKTNPEIATILSISEGTVKKHLEQIFEKLGVGKRGAASLIAMEALVS